ASSSRFVSSDDEQVVKVRLEQVSDGRTRSVLVLIDDATNDARAEAELMALRERVAHQDRLRILGEITAGIVHDLGNALNGMVLRLAAAKNEADAAGMRRHLDELGRAL